MTGGSGLVEMKNHYTKMRKENLEPAFSKFDKDGNGTIDAKELG